MSKDIAEAAFDQIEEGQEAADFIEYDDRFETMPDDVRLREVAELCNRYITLKQNVVLREADLTAAKAELRQLEERDLPDRMLELGLTTFGLSDGTTVEVKPEVYCSITTERQIAAFDWLRANGFEKLIKNQIVISLGKNEDSVAQDIVSFLNREGYDDRYNLKQEVHPQTLKAFVKEQDGLGRAVPDVLFGVYRTNRAKVKR